MQAAHARIRGQWPSRQELFRSHLATAWVLLGAFLLYATLFFSPHDLNALFTWGNIVGCFFVLFLLPLCVVLLSVAVITITCAPHSRFAPNTLYEAWPVCLYFACVVAYLFLWRSVWYIMYERRRRVPANRATAP